MSRPRQPKLGKQPHRRVIYRMLSDDDTARRIIARRFNRTMDRIDRRQRSHGDMAVWNGAGWAWTGGRGLIHNGGKPRG